MITGCTNSTATWCACAGHAGATHHIVAPAEKRRASASEVAARSDAASGTQPGSALDTETPVPRVRRCTSG